MGPPRVTRRVPHTHCHELGEHPRIINKEDGQTNEGTKVEKKKEGVGSPWDARRAGKSRTRGFTKHPLFDQKSSSQSNRSQDSTVLSDAMASFAFAFTPLVLPLRCPCFFWRDGIGTNKCSSFDAGLPGMSMDCGWLRLCCV